MATYIDCGIFVATIIVMNRLSRDKRIQIISCLTEGMTVNGVTRVVGVSKNAVLRLLCDVGCVCAELQDRALRDLPCRRLQVDEAWQFCGMKQKNVPTDKQGILGYGDVWVWSCIDRDYKLIVRAMLGHRDAPTARVFIQDVSARMANRVQLSSDALAVYHTAVRDAFPLGVDYAIIKKTYATPLEPERRYTPPRCVGCKKTAVFGQPIRRDVSTSHIERSHLTLRLTQKRWARLTTAFSRKLENMRAAMDLHTAVYNFVKVHSTLGETPAQAIGITFRKWEIADIIDLLEESEASRVPSQSSK